MDGYMYLKQIGSGSFGKVIKAESVRDQMLYAIKQMEKSKLRVEFRKKLNAHDEKTKKLVDDIMNFTIKNEVELLRSLVRNVLWHANIAESSQHRKIQELS